MPAGIVRDRRCISRHATRIANTAAAPDPPGDVDPAIENEPDPELDAVLIGGFAEWESSSSVVDESADTEAPSTLADKTDQADEDEPRSVV
jgi:hypothetical protein